MIEPGGLSQFISPSDVEGGTYEYDMISAKQGGMWDTTTSGTMALLYSPSFLCIFVLF